MTTPIVIATNFGREAWVSDLTSSLCGRDYVVVSRGGYELGKMRWVVENTTWNRFVFLPDSVVITDPSVFDRIDDTDGSICLHHFGGQHFSCYLGVFQSIALLDTGMPLSEHKEDSVRYESTWPMEYGLHAEITCFDTRPDEFLPLEWRHGRENLPYDTGYLIKYRGDWGQRELIDR